MSLVCVGINHKLAPVELRERLAVPETAVPEALRSISATGGVGECVVVSTCNRVEVYAAAPADEGGPADPPAPQVTEFLRARFASEAGLDLPLYEHLGIDAARHLFRVASGLDSMVLGETEIFGQVKKAYTVAHAAGTTRGALNRLFQNAFRVGKRIRTETEIQRGATSVGAVAVDLAEKIFGRLGDCSVLLLGAGEISRTTAQSLASRGAGSISVANRSLDRAEKLAGPLGGKAFPFDRWFEELPAMDILISSTSADGYVVDLDHVRKVMDQRRGRPLFLIDIAVPRDIDPAIDEIDNVYLYDIDALEATASQGRAHRAKQIAVCEEVIATEAAQFFRR